MAEDLKKTYPTAALKHRDKGVRIFAYPKIIFIYPTMLVALFCAIGMRVIHDKTEHHPNAVVTAGTAGNGQPAATTDVGVEPHARFYRAANLMGVFFLAMFAFNMLIMAIDFPRFTILAFVLLGGMLLFLLLWIGALSDMALSRFFHKIMSGVFVTANSGFYLMVSLIIFLTLATVWATRWLDYWEILPNEILHHHGPLSDLERYPTMNLKFDKEIPDVFEYGVFLVRAGRLVLHVADERKSIVLDNVLDIDRKEMRLKSLMSRMEVRVTTDQEVSDTTS